MIAGTPSKSGKKRTQTKAAPSDQPYQVPAAIAERLTGIKQAEEIRVIPLGQLVRHPLNRTIDPASDEIKQLSQSIAEFGQLDPLRVRPIAKDQYQIISGERRYHALTLARAYGAKCIIVECDDAHALQEVAAANSNRQDLNPVERGQMMQQLMRPASEGGSGLTLLEAGAIFGLTSESGCKNALRLMRLPQSILELVIKGELPERHARKLVTYVDAKPVMDKIVATLVDGDAYDRSEMIAELMQDAPFTVPLWELNEVARPIAPDVQRSNRYPVGSHPCLFNWQDHEKELQIVELPTECGFDQKQKRQRIEPRKWALNTKLWDKLQEPFIKALEKGAKSTKQSGKSSKLDAKSLPKKQTPAQIAADAKRKAAEADKRLADFSRDWLDRLLRCSIADRSTNDELVARTIGWLSACVSTGSGLSLRCHAEQALIDLQASVPKGFGVIDQLPIAAKLASEQTFDLLAAYWRLILWPVSRLVSDKANAKCRLTPAGQLPDRIAHIMPGDLRQLATIAGVSAESAWRDGATDGTDQRRLISVWLMRHTKEQLHKLRGELGVTEGSSTMGRDELVGCILNAHRPGKPLPLPKRLASIDK